MRTEGPSSTRLCKNPRLAHVGVIFKNFTTERGSKIIILKFIMYEKRTRSES